MCNRIVLIILLLSFSNLYIYMHCVIVLTCPLTCSTTDSAIDHSCVAFSNCSCSTAFLTASAALLTSARPASSSSDCTQCKSRLRPPSQWRHTQCDDQQTEKKVLFTPYRGVEVRSPGHDRVCNGTRISCCTMDSADTLQMRNSPKSYFWMWNYPRDGGLLYWNPVWYWPRGEIQESPSATPAKLHFTFPCPTACVSEKEEN